MIQRVQGARLKDRLDAHYYQKEFVLNELFLNKAGFDRISIGDVIKPDSPITYGIVQPGKFQPYGIGVRMIRCVDITDWYLKNNNVVWVHESVAYPYRRSSIRAGDYLLSIVGTVGRAAIAPEEIEPANLNQSVARLRFDYKKIDSYWVLAFHMSRFGQLSILREQKGYIQKRINIEDIPGFLVLVPKHRTQKYIGDKLRQAEKLRALAWQDNHKIKYLLSPLNPSDLAEGRTSRTSVSMLSDSLNPNAYMPYFIQAEEIVRGFDCAPLEKVSISVADGPFGSNLKVEDYKTGEAAKHPVVRVTNCVDGIFQEEELVWINDVKQKELKRSIVLSGDLLVTKAGRIGSAAVYPDSLPSGNITSHLVRARLKKEYDPYYVAEYFETKVGKAVTLRHSFKSTRPELTKTEIENCNIAFIDQPTLKIVGALSRRKSLFTKQSILLTCAARLLVEALIEDKIPETDLITAQMSLETGDRAADREILGRLTPKGMDMAGEPPLFPNLDGLYEALDALGKSEEAP